MCTEKENLRIKLLRNSLLMQDSWTSTATGITLTENNFSEIDLIGMFFMMDISLMMVFIFLEMTLTTAINLDFILTLTRSFNRARNLRYISNLQSMMQLFIFVMTASVLIDFRRDLDKESSENEIYKLGLSQGYGLKSYINIELRHALFFIQVFFLLTCALILILAIFSFWQRRKN